MKLFFTTLALYGSEKVLGTLLIIVMLTIVVLAICTPYLNWFRREMKYINTEIQRNKENERERNRWKRRKRRLLLSLIPFVPYE